MADEKLRVGGCAISSDHAGYDTKEFIKTSLYTSGIDITDLGPSSSDSVDYPDFVHPIASQVASGEIDKAVILCGSGNGVAMTANKYPSVRAALCWNEDIVKLARQHNDANILCLPARFISKEEALTFIDIFLNTSFEGGRHQRRIDKIPLLK